MLRIIVPGTVDIIIKATDPAADASLVDGCAKSALADLVRLRCPLDSPFLHAEVVQDC
jgi:hypothetical protein